MPFRSHRHESFSAFQAFIKQWLTKNLSAVQLDGSEIPKKNPITTDEVTLDKPLNTVVIGSIRHGLNEDGATGRSARLEPTSPGAKRTQTGAAGGGV